MSALALHAARCRATPLPELVQHIDARWLMAYSAAVGDTARACYDTLRVGGPRAHPLFVVAVEWPAVEAARAALVPPDVAARGVHATHRLRLHRLPEAGDTLTTRTRVAGLEPTRAGALLVLDLETTDAGGQAVATTAYGSLFRGVAVDGPGLSAGRRDVARAAPEHQLGDLAGRQLGDVAGRRLGDPAGPLWDEAVAVPSTLAHIYSECARIWNPIHTDLAAARAAGLPAPILHGTATLALAVSRVVARELGGDAERLAAIEARFTGPVGLPSDLRVRAWAPVDRRLPFDVVSAGGNLLLSGHALAGGQR